VVGGVVIIVAQCSNFLLKYSSSKALQVLVLENKKKTGRVGRVVMVCVPPATNFFVQDHDNQRTRPTTAQRPRHARWPRARALRAAVRGSSGTFDQVLATVL